MHDLKIVSKSSAKGRFPQDEPIGIDEDHIGICKLNSKSDLLYRNIESFLEEILDDTDNLSMVYKKIESGLLDATPTDSSQKDKIFLIFTQDNNSSIKYQVEGYIQCEGEFENELIEFTFENIHNENEQEKFIETIFLDSELDNVPIHFILPPSLFLINLKQWKYKGSEFKKLYHILLHNKERFDKNINKYDNMITNWNNVFEVFKNSDISHSLLVTTNDDDRLDTGDDKIGVCFKQRISHYGLIQNTLIMAYVGLWQYRDGLLTDYCTWINNGVCLNKLNENSRKCDHMALLWDDMSLLIKLKDFTDKRKK